MKLLSTTTSKCKKWLIYGVTTTMLLGAGMLTESTQAHAAGSFVHTVQSGESLYLIGKKYGVSVEQLKQWNLRKSDWIYPNEQLIVFPTVTYVVRSGDFLWKIARERGTTVAAIKEVNFLQTDMIYPGQALKIPVSTTPETSYSQGEVQTPAQSWTEYKTHTVKQGETGWTIALDYGIPFSEFLKLNQLTESSILMPGQQVTVAIHHIAAKPTAGAQYGEYLDWWTEAQYVWPIGTIATVKDLQTGVSWKMKRTIGAFHADVEPLTSTDTAIMKNVWGGEWSWTRRPVIVDVNGHRIAASASAMPHSIQYITNNQFPGHTDIHFANSRRHSDNQVDQAHQENILKSAGRN